MSDPEDNPSPPQTQPWSDVVRDATAAKDFLSWAREQGFAFESVCIGRVQLVGTRDLCPSIKAQAHQVGEAERWAASEQGGDGSVYAGMPGAEHFPPGTRPG